MKLQILILAAVAALVGGCQSSGVGGVRNISFSDGGCRVPPGSIEASNGVHTFTLEHGNIGGCFNDAQARHEAPYWERTELASTYLQMGKSYEISFDVNFDPSTTSSNRTTFFQIHTSNQRCRLCAPALMLKANTGGSITASLLNARGFHTDHTLPVTRRSLAGDWTNVEIRTTTDPGLNDVSIYVDGRRVLASTMAIPDKGKVFLRTGLYRPGNRAGLPTDRISIRNVTTEILAEE